MRTYSLVRSHINGIICHSYLEGIGSYNDKVVVCSIRHILFGDLYPLRTHDPLHMQDYGGLVMR